MIFSPIKVYVQLLNPNCCPLATEKGDLIDLRAAATMDLEGPYVVLGAGIGKVAFNNYMVPLGVRILVPEGFKCDLVARSGTYKNYGVVLANCEGKIDQTYNGPTDQWMANYIAFKSTTIKEGDRIAQFEVTLSPKATWRQKLKWLFHSGIELVVVDNIDTTINRDGFSSSGVV